MKQQQPFHQADKFYEEQNNFSNTRIEFRKKMGSGSVFMRLADVRRNVM
jgi:hypothetical protein